MSFNFEFKIDGVKIKTPSSFKIDFNPITEAERTLDGSMLIEGIAGKGKIVLTYDEITDTELMGILGVTWTEFLSSRKIKQTLTYTAPGGASATMNTYFAPFSISMTKESAIRGKWQGLALEFTEI
jgi:hypothetical protein